jgi:pterin-4a-carbinolamine dehydratase
MGDLTKTVSQMRRLRPFHGLGLATRVPLRCTSTTAIIRDTGSDGKPEQSHLHKRGPHSKTVPITLKNFKFNAGPTQRTASTAIANTPKPTIKTDAGIVENTRIDVNGISVLDKPKANKEKLAQDLKSLVFREDGYEHHWWLVPEGDAIQAVRYFTNNDASTAKSQIMKFADEIGHHPHISYEAIPILPKSLRIKSLKSSGCQVMVISCTSHKPRGLGKKDIMLARGIDDILTKFSVREHTSLHHKPAPGEAPVVDILPGHMDRHRNEIDAAVSGIK